LEHRQRTYVARFAGFGFWLNTPTACAVGYYIRRQLRWLDSNLHPVKALE
jgi:hypothetical protein